MGAQWKKGPGGGSGSAVWTLSLSLVSVWPSVSFSPFYTLATRRLTAVPCPPWLWDTDHIYNIYQAIFTERKRALERELLACGLTSTTTIVTSHFDTKEFWLWNLEGECILHPKLLLSSPKYGGG